MRLAFRILNVFAVDGGRFTGNPLCVFEDGTGLTTASMLALARQFNLSETSFILPSENATAAVRIFTPAMELPFAGHPTLGTAEVVRDLKRAPPQITLSMQAGIIPVSAEQNIWTLTAGQPQSRELEDGRIATLLPALGLTAPDIASNPLWVSTGMEQLLIPLTSVEAVNRAHAGPGLSAFANGFGKVGVYVFSPLSDEAVAVRFFFGKAGGALMEDPATGSACANLGGFALATGISPPFARILSQGSQVERPSRLRLSVDKSGKILVGGEVIEIGRGYVHI